VAFYTDKASLFVTAEKRLRDRPAERVDTADLPPTQIGRELGFTWIAAHSPQAKGRIERSFGTAQDRLVKGLRVAGVATMDEANPYLRTRVSAVVESASGGLAGQSGRCPPAAGIRLRRRFIRSHGARWFARG
jgi:hypothetical protein